ncbi:TetR/AcrR family transcriptional regulator [Georgenia halophila]|uniref:TetR/AcrR family transcriptional regulator n=1 Tax=Georgenia halophila TaxID=620889 RepID=A0ABP8KSI5_9MICO
MSAGKQPREPARDRLLRAAEELFYAHGIAAVGVDAVVERAGVATASLYKNFAGKDGLVAEYLRTRDERWRQHWESCITSHDDPLERALAVFTALDTWEADAGRHNGCAHLAALQQLAGDHAGSAVAREHKAHLRHRLGELVAAVGVRDADSAATDLLLIYEGTLALQAQDVASDPVERGGRLARRRLENPTSQ